MLKSSAVTLGRASECVMQELGESGMKKLRQNEQHVSAPPCCRGTSLHSSKRSWGASVTEAGWGNRAWETGAWEGRWPSGLAVRWQGSRAPYRSCKACSAPGFVAGKAFHLVSVCGVRYGFCGAIFLCKGKGYFSKCYICIVRENNVESFSFPRKHCCVVEVAWVASSVSLYLQLLFILLIKDRLGKSLWESDYGLLFHSSSERAKLSTDI